MKAWYIPAWNGDWRLEPDPAAPDKQTLLTIKKPTAEEKRVLIEMQKAFDEKKWLDSGPSRDRMKDPSSWRTTKAKILAPLADIGPIIASIVKPGSNVLTAIRFTDGRIESCSTSEPAKPGEKSKPSEESKALAKKPDAAAAATVKRPTPCCPSCYEDPREVNKPATETLLAFLNEEEHESWAKHRYIVVRGGITGHRYLLAHRNSEIAQRNTRMGFDLDDNSVMHWHDWTVPAEEEVLASMLILKMREPWLRNEATAFSGCTYVFKNPFGGFDDGIPDSSWTRDVGQRLLEALGLITPRPRRSVLGARGARVNATLESDGSITLYDDVS